MELVLAVQCLSAASAMCINTKKRSASIKILVGHLSELLLLPGDSMSTAEARHTTPPLRCYAWCICHRYYYSNTEWLEDQMTDHDFCARTQACMSACLLSKDWMAADSTSSAVVGCHLLIDNTKRGLTSWENTPKETTCISCRLSSRIGLRVWLLCM